MEVVQDLLNNLPRLNTSSFDMIKKTIGELIDFGVTSTTLIDSIDVDVSILRWKYYETISNEYIPLIRSIIDILRKTPDFWTSNHF